MVSKQWTYAFISTMSIDRVSVLRLLSVCRSCDCRSKVNIFFHLHYVSFLFFLFHRIAASTLHAQARLHLATTLQMPSTCHVAMLWWHCACTYPYLHPHDICMLWFVPVYATTINHLLILASPINMQHFDAPVLSNMWTGCIIQTTHTLYDIKSNGCDVVADYIASLVYINLTVLTIRLFLNMDRNNDSSVFILHENPLNHGVLMYMHVTHTLLS